MSTSEGSNEKQTTDDMATSSNIITKKSLLDFISRSMHGFGYRTKAEYYNGRAKKNFVILDPVGEENGKTLYKPQVWENGDLVVLNTRELADEEAREYEGSAVVSEYELYVLYGIIAA